MAPIRGLDCDKNIEWYVDSLAADGLQATAIVACLLRYDEAGPLLVELVTRAADGEAFDNGGEQIDDEDDEPVDDDDEPVDDDDEPVDDDDEPVDDDDGAVDDDDGTVDDDDGAVDDDRAHQFFSAIHIVAGAQDVRAFAPLLRLLRRPEAERQPLLAGLDFTLPRVVIATFDGDCESLFAAIEDPRIGDLNRAALLAAATYIAWEGRIERSRMVDFLRGFATPAGSEATPHLWGTWAMAIAHLGLRDLEQAGRAAFADDRVGDTIDEAYFGQVLAEAERMPDDTGRFVIDDLGYIDNALETLQRYYELDEDDMDDLDGLDGMDDMFGDLAPVEPLGGGRPVPFMPQAPVINPLRHVGRNDPCPCGSGKKAKRCCLAG
jgi:hypothetical protein